MNWNVGIFKDNIRGKINFVTEVFSGYTMEDAHDLCDEVNASFGIDSSGKSFVVSAGQRYAMIYSDEERPFAMGVC